MFGADVRLVLGGMGALIALYIFAQPKNSSAIQTVIKDATGGIAKIISTLQGH